MGGARSGDALYEPMARGRARRSGTYSSCSSGAELERLALSRAQPCRRVFATLPLHDSGALRRNPEAGFLRRSPRASGGVRHGRPSKVRLHHSHAPDPPSRGRPRRAAEEWQTPAGMAAPRGRRVSAQRRANRSAKSSREAGRTLTCRALLERPRSPDQGHASGASNSCDGRRSPWPPAIAGNAEEIPPRDFFEARSSSARQVSVLPASRLDFAQMTLASCSWLLPPPSPSSQRREQVMPLICRDTTQAQF